MNSVLLIDALGWVLILAGSVFLVTGAIGLIRFPDFWSRLHALSVLDSAGVLLLLAGMCIQGGWSLVTVKLVIIGLFLLITGPTATHALANAALVSGLRPLPGTGGPDPVTEDPAASEPGVDH